MSDDDKAVSHDVHTMSNLNRAIGRIEGKLDALNSQMVAHSALAHEDRVKMDARVRRVEARNNINSGAIGVVVTIFAVVIGWIKYGGNGG